MPNLSEEVLEAVLAEAYEQGCCDTHTSIQAEPELALMPVESAEFGEAASDYAHHALTTYIRQSIEEQGSVACGLAPVSLPVCRTSEATPSEARRWTFDPVCFDQRIPIHGGVTAFGRPYVVAWVNRPRSARAGEDKAAAHLIAAAPELLSELKWCFMGAGNLARMAAVIARAEGRS